MAAVALDVVWHSSHRPVENRGRHLQREGFIDMKFTPAS
jgi:hypothetical protein